MRLRALTCGDARKEREECKGSADSADLMLTTVLLARRFRGPHRGAPL